MVLLRGGARIGKINLTWPFAKLKIADGVLVLNASIFSNHYFLKEDVVSIEPYAGIFTNGLRIIHNVKEYNDEIIFWSFSDFKRITNLINNNMTLEIKDDIKFLVKKSQKAGPRVFKSRSVIFLGITFFLLLSLKYYSFFKLFLKEETTSNIFIELIHNLIFIYLLVVCCGLILSEKFRKLLYKESAAKDVDSGFLIFILLLNFILLIASLKAGV